MRMYFLSIYKGWTGFLSVYGIIRCYDSNIVYKLHYLCGVVISLKVGHCESNRISSLINLGVSLMLPPEVSSNPPVRLKAQFSKQ